MEKSDRRGKNQTTVLSVLVIHIKINLLPHTANSF